MISSVLRLPPPTIKNETRNSPPRLGHGRRHKALWCDGGLKRASGSYPENDVEAEDEVLDAAAHFMSLEVLPGNHRDAFLLVVRLDRHREPVKRVEWTEGFASSPAAQVFDSVAYIYYSQRRGFVGLFQRPILNMMPCVGQQKAGEEEVRRRRESRSGAAAASDGPGGNVRSAPVKRRSKEIIHRMERD